MRRLIATAFVAALAAAGPLSGTATGEQSALPASELRVIVRDPSGGALVAARVIVVDAAGRMVEAGVDDQGVAGIRGLVAGAARLRVEADAFEPYDGVIALRRGTNTVTVELPLAGLSEEVIVMEERDDRRGNAFTTILGDREIADLPDDPDELEQVLLEMAGPDAVMRVNGFRGGRLPPKSQIRQIRFRRNSFAAENHDAGGVGIDVITRPGAEGWRGMTSFAFRDESLNASNAFADSTGPEQYRRFNFNIDGPLAKGTTSFSFMTDGNLSYDSQTIVAATPGRLVSEQIRQPIDDVNATARVQHALTETQTLLVEYQSRRDDRRNLGVGDFDLPTRAYSRNRDDHRVRFSLNGAVASNIASELKVQFDVDRERLSSSFDDPAIVVIDAFASGGAGQQLDRRVRQLEVEENLDFSFGRRHAVRAGFLLESRWYRESQLRNGNGTFTFASLEAFEAGTPNTWTQRVGGAPIDFAQHQLGVYLQDDITFSRQLSVSVGVRQELQNTLGDRVNLAPRVGFTWSPGKWTLRGGWGIFNDWYGASIHGQTLLVDGVNQRELIVLQPGYPDPFAGTGATALPPGIVSVVQGLDMAYLSQASVGAERSFGDLRVQASYTAQRGFNQPRSRNANAPAAGARPNPLLGNVTAIESTGRENVDRVHVGASFTRPERRLFVNANYVLSRTLNHSDSPLQLPADNVDLDGEWGPSSQDARHRLFAMASVGLPGEFRIMLMSQASSARPYTVITGLDTNADGTTNDRPEGAQRNGARGTASWNLNTRLAKVFSFGPPRTGTPGPGPEGIRVRGGRGRRGGGPGGNIMMSAADPDAGRYRVELYLQAFNLLNRANYTRFSGNLRSPFFGTPTAAGPARRLELGLLFGF